ncbi:MAG: enolase C-terminal domain-like protein [Acidimicrobiia bacterium]
MHSIQKLRWKEVVSDVLTSSDIAYEWFKVSFSSGYTTDDRDGIYVSGPYGIAEVSPLPAYFDDDLFCLLAAIDTVSKPWPNIIESEIKINGLVSNDYDLEKDELNSFDCIKVKVHTLRDCERVKKVRDIYGNSKKIRIDCNARFSVEEALEIAQILKSVDLEMIEQPCRTIKKCAKVRKKIDIPICIDELARNFEEIDEIKRKEAADIIAIKIQPCGGLHKAYELSQYWGGDVIVSHMMETEVGLNVATTLAKSLHKSNYAHGLNPLPIKKLIREPLDS